MRRVLSAILVSSVFCCACSSPKELEPVDEYYEVPFRQLPPEPVYSRMTWSNPPQPIPEPSQEKTPYLQPVIEFEFPDSNLKEAIQALAQTIGYRWDYPPNVASRKISIKRVGTVDEILGEIGRQAGVRTQLDHTSRMVRVLHSNTSPQLPGSSN
ncbi:MAG: hypothetical protein KDD66_04725 [Bdellovibrionales bacterium]|nr:hypothetical protein [Bdellovibrionales bacterium]